jgi:uncharacterized protein YndB with AHSA1/START domain
MLKFILAIVVIAIVAVLGYAAIRPDSFRVQRSATIKAPPEKIYALIQDFNQWGAWSPYEKRDPAMHRIYGDITAGKGATYAWDGNRNVGKGHMEITETVPPSATSAGKILIKLDFEKPIEGHNIAEFTVEPQSGDTTAVTWAMSGPSPYVAKLMGVFFNMDKMIGKEFEAGLANLKTASEQ